MNTLFYGDNLNVLRQHVADSSVDLVYLDPPFQSGKDYNVIFESHQGERGDERAQAEAFKDTWSWRTGEAEEQYAEIDQAGGELAVALRSLRAILKESDLMAYVCMMAPRLVELRRVMKPSASLYLHCDPTASHYLKVLLDSILGPACFRNEIIWRYRRWPAKARRFQRMHDVLLFYTARPAGQHSFNVLYGYEKLADSTLKTFGTKKQRADFSSGHRKPSVEEAETAGPPLSDYWDLDDLETQGVPLADCWEVGVIAAIGKERTGYATQKPEKLLERVIRASSREGDLVLDPFCGCGTAIAVAERLGRRWIGVDANQLAVQIVRTSPRFENASFAVKGEPTDLEGARALAERDPQQFRWWILGRVGARPCDLSRGADADIDGELFLRGAATEVSESRDPRIVFLVRADTVDASAILDLTSVVERDGAAMGVLVTLEEPSPAVREAAARGGFCELAKRRHPRLQIVTVGRLLASPGRAAIDAPRAHVKDEKTVRKAPLTRTSSARMRAVALR